MDNSSMVDMVRNLPTGICDDPETTKPSTNYNPT
jgi:hypothetical protein